MMTPSLFHENFDLFDQFYRDPWFMFDDREFRNMEKKLYGRRGKNIMNTDIKESDSNYEMSIDLPGFKKEDVQIALHNGYMIISASREYEKGADTNKKDDKNGNYIRHERYSGSCQRSFYVGGNITTDEIKAKFEHGILYLTIPKKDAKTIDANKYVAIEG